MRMTVNIDSILDNIATLSLEDQEFLDDIMRKRIIEGKREAILKEYEQSKEDRCNGTICSGTVNDLFGHV